MKKSFLKISSLLFLFVLLISCDKDFNSLDSDVIGDDHFDLVYDEASLVAYSKATGVVQTNNLPLNALGIYKNDFFGTTKAHFVTQVELGSENPSFGFNPIIDSVYLYVPYFTELKSTETSGERVYELDSIYGNAETGKFRLKVLENGYYLRDLDPADNLQSSQRYFNDDKATKIDPFKGSELLNNSSNIAQNDEFYFSKKELYIYKTNGAGLYVDSNGAVLSDQNNVTLRVIKERKTPGMWLDLKNSFFQQKILDAASTANLFSNNAFKNYFRGLLFEVEEINPDQGALAVLDFSKAELKILYKAASEAVSVENPTPTRTRRTFSLKMGYNASTTLRNNSINLLEYNNSTEYDAGLAGSNEVLGSDRLYVKGGNGSVAFIDLFTPTELETLRNNIATKNWLINDAKLTFYIDKSKMLNEDNEPERIYIYDATNNMVIADYTFDSSSGFNPKNNKLVFGGIIERETEDPKRGIKYTIRLTEHIKRILKADSNGEFQDNIKIGVSVTESINLVSSAKLKAPISANGVQISDIPLASILNPLGTVLFGNVVTDPDDEDKKLKLSIYFTKPNNE